MIPFRSFCTPIHRQEWTGRGLVGADADLRDGSTAACTGSYYAAISPISLNFVPAPPEDSHPVQNDLS